MPYHDRYTWLVQTVTLDNAQDALNKITIATHEVYATHLVQHGEESKLVIIARQHGDVTKTRNEDLAEGARLTKEARDNPPFQFSIVAPFAGTYTSECGHVKQKRFLKSVGFQACPVCKTNVSWALIEADPPNLAK